MTARYFLWKSICMMIVAEMYIMCLYLGLLTHVKIILDKCVNYEVLVRIVGCIYEILLRGKNNT